MLGMKKLVIGLQFATALLLLVEAAGNYSLVRSVRAIKAEATAPRRTAVPDISHRLSFTHATGDGFYTTVLEVWSNPGAPCPDGLHDVVPFAPGLVCGKDGMSTREIFDDARRLSDDQVRKHCCVGATCMSVPTDCPEIDDI